MVEESISPAGSRAGSGRILRELLRTPRFKKMVNVLLSELDPENAAILIRTLVMDDPQFFLGLLGSAPSLINMGVSGFAEMCRLLNDFPPELLASFLVESAKELDARQVGEAIGYTLLLALSVGKGETLELGEAGTDFAVRFQKGLAASLSQEAREGESAAALLLEKLIPAMASLATKLGEQAAREGSEMNLLVTGLVDGVRTIAAENPQFMKSVVSPLVEVVQEVLDEAELSGGAKE